MSFRAYPSPRVLLPLALAALSLLMMGSQCARNMDPRVAGSPFFHFRGPSHGLLSLSDQDTNVSLSILDLGFLARVKEIEVALDGMPLIDLAGGGLILQDGLAEGEIASLAPGEYQLSAVARLRIFFFIEVELAARTWFERIELDRPADCEILNGIECILPFPSARYLEEASTPTGYQVAYPDAVLPPFPASLSSAAFSGQDGFSPAVQVLMHIPGGVDLVRSDASRLLASSRSIDDTSLRVDSPSLLIDLDAGGQRVAHFLERDVNAAGSPTPEREVLFLRPARLLTPGHRYAVALRRLRHADDTQVEAEPPFAALRDRRDSDIPALEARREANEVLLAQLREAGVERDDLILAFDFVVQSDEGLTRELLAMRDRAYDWLSNQGQQTFSVLPFGSPNDPPSPAYSQEFDCSVPGERLWRIIRGRFEAPLFLSSDPLLLPVVGGRLVDLDADGLPDADGNLMEANFSAEIPCAALTRPDKLLPIIGGHGLFGNNLQSAGMARSIDGRQAANGLDPLERIAFSTDWLGLSSFDFNFSQILRPSFIVHGILLDANNFGALPDRLRQGMSNALVLTRMAKLGLFNQDPAFQTPNGEGVLPGASAPIDYIGVSLGGIMGTELGALSPDLERMALDVPAANFSVLVQRSNAIGLISIVLNLLNPDPMHQVIFFGLAEELWDSGEPAGYLSHVTHDPLPGSGAAKDLLYTVARYDGIVSNEASEIAARTLGLPNLYDADAHAGSAVSGLLEIPDVSEVGDESDDDFVGAFLYFDLGMYDEANPDHAPFIPALANTPTRSRCDPHGRSFSSGAVALQIQSWLEAGVIENVCDGLCDGLAGDGSPAPFELVGGESVPCDPLPAAAAF